jgi:hypothetical protein
MPQNSRMAPKARASLTSLERLERQLQAITPDRAQGDAWEKALKGWINAGGHPELTRAWTWGEWPGKLKDGLKVAKGEDLAADAFREVSSEHGNSAHICCEPTTPSIYGGWSHHVSTF